MILLDMNFPSVDPSTLNLTSVAGITSITFLILEMLKAYIQPRTPFLGKVPTWVFPLVISFSLAFVANKLIIVDNHPALEGNFWVICGKAFLAAVGSSGVHATLKNITTPIGQSKPLVESKQEKS